MSGRFEYQKVDPARREIRLIELFPRTHHLSKARPACRMFHASLDEDPPFLALSYVWGDRKDGRIILVDKRPFRVTRNLFEAMMGFEEAESMIVWIDAICINQMDDEEKGWQVGLMGDIYRQAFGVLAWLGAPADNSDTVIDYLNMLGERAEACGLHNGPQGCTSIWQAIATTPSYMQDPAKIVLKSWLDRRLISVSKRDLEQLLDSISGWKSQDQLLPIAGLRRLLRRAWWGRVWVLQEITLPERAYFACGTKRISRQRFRAAFNAYYALSVTLSSKMQQQQSLTSYQTDVVFTASHRAHVMLSLSNVYRLERFPLVGLLRATCVGSMHHLKEDGYQHLDSTDSRDKIFALLGIAEDQRELEALGVLPDYTSSKKEVYMTTAAALLQQGHTSILSLCAAKTSGDLPSWVPDWSIPMPELLQEMKNDHLTLYPKSNACGSETQNRINISRKGRKITGISVMAIVYDEVARIGVVPRMPNTETCLHPFQWLYELLRLTYAATGTYADFNERLKAVVRTSHTAIGYGEDTKLKRVNRFFDALPIFRDGVSSIRRQDIKQQLGDFLASKVVKGLLKSGCGVPAKLIHDLMRVTVKRSPFITKKGNLGISSWDVKPGDVVAIIAGAQVPFVLRRVENGKYVIVSEAYIDGIMDGEAAEDGEWGHIHLD